MQRAASVVHDWIKQENWDKNEAQIRFTTLLGEQLMKEYPCKNVLIFSDTRSPYRLQNGQRILWHFADRHGVMKIDYQIILFDSGAFENVGLMVCSFRYD